jgi:hypothetical protein
MKVLLFIAVYYMDLSSHKVKLLWNDVVEQESIEQCKEQGNRYKYLVEISEHIEVQYFCRKGV